MKTLCFVVAAVLMLFPGCKASPKTSVPSADTTVLAKDTMERMLALYPPAKTRLHLQHPAADAFGSQLLSSLREQGYAVAEYTPPLKKNNGAASGFAPLPSNDASVNYVFAYALDDTNGETRLSLRVGEDSMSRLYARHEGEDGTFSFIPIADWTRRH